LEYLKRHEQFDFKRDKIEFLPATRGMASSTSSGLIVDGNLETNISGLFAAGDDVGGVPWKSAPGALTMGWRAGEMAAKSALERKEFAPIDKNTVELFEGHVRLMLGRNGNHWREIELALQKHHGPLLRRCSNGSPSEAWNPTTQEPSRQYCSCGRRCP